LLSHEQRAAVENVVKDFTCRGARHENDPTVEGGDSFLRDGGWADCDENGITRTWVAIVDGVIAGYVALASDAISLTGSEKKRAELGELSFTRYGCTQISMLAVRANFQGCELRVGSALVDHAVFVGLETGRSVGARFLTADVNPAAQGFYEKYGFESLLGQSDDLKKRRGKGLVPMVLDLWPGSETAS
jgi:ribosomal protein S18 acetylase RimI-like enzyme